MPRITFVNEVRTVEVAPGVTLVEAAAKAGVNLLGASPGARCGASGRCLGGRCKVWTSGPLSARTFWERLHTSRSAGMRLACQARVLDGDVEVRTPPGAVSFTPTTRWDPDEASALSWKNGRGK